MTDKKLILQTLQTVFNKQESISSFGVTMRNLDLLAPSLTGLASSIKDDRQRLISIITGKATDSTINKVLANLEAYLKIDLDTIHSIEDVVNMVAVFENSIKEEIHCSNYESPFHVILPFLTHKYSSFSENFQFGKLQSLLQLLSSNPRTFYTMLAWYYIKHSHVKFYNSDLSHGERCVNILEPLCEKIMEIVPHNEGVASIMYSYTIFKDWESEPQILWSLVVSISYMLEMFASPIGLKEKYGHSRVIPGLSSRSYWRVCGSHDIFLFWLYPGREPGIGHYELFIIDPQTKEFEDIAALSLLNEDIIVIHSKHIESIQSAFFNYNTNALSIEWISPNNDPMWPGNKFERIFTETSQSLRELDRLLTNEDLTHKMMLSFGLKYDISLQPYDVVISTHRLILFLNDRSRWSISLNHAPFLRKITPSEPIIIARDIKDGEVIVFWLGIHQFIPLKEFTCISQTIQ